MKITVNELFENGIMLLSHDSLYCYLIYRETFRERSVLSAFFIYGNR